MDEFSIGPSGVHQDAIHHKQIHHESNNVTGVDGGLAIQQAVYDPQQTGEGKDGPRRQRLTGRMLGVREVQLGKGRNGGEGLYNSCNHHQRLEDLKCP